MLKAVGLNKSAARYAGINEKKNIILSMAIAGALAGFGAGLFYLSNVSQWNPLNSTSLPGMGFNGISVALLASSNPIGTVFSALFISHISVGGSFLSTKFYPTEISDLISGIIIYLCAFSMLYSRVYLIRSSILLALLFGLFCGRRRLCVHVGLFGISEQQALDLAPEQHGECAQIDDDAADQIRDLSGVKFGGQEGACACRRKDQKGGQVICCF